MFHSIIIVLGTYELVFIDLSRLMFGMVLHISLAVNFSYVIVVSETDSATVLINLVAQRY